MNHLQVKNKYNTLKKEYTVYHKMVTKSGIGSASEGRFSKDSDWIAYASQNKGVEAYRFVLVDVLLVKKRTSYRLFFVHQILRLSVLY